MSCWGYVTYSNTYLEGQGDFFFGRLMMGIIQVTIWVIGVSNLSTKVS